MGLGGYDHWKTTDPRDAEPWGDEDKREAEQAEERDYLRQQAANDARDEAFLSAIGGIQHGVSELEDLRHRIERARTLVHQALSAAESGYPLLRMDSLLTSALSELGCAGCGKHISEREMREVVWTRKHGVHFKGDCFERARALGRVS